MSVPVAGEGLVDRRLAFSSQVRLEIRTPIGYRDVPLFEDLYLVRDIRRRGRLAVPDVIVGAPAFDNPESDEGRAFAFLGSPSNLAPRARIAATPVVECDRPGGALVTLDGSGSEDPDSDGGIVSYEWRRLEGAPGGALLGSGPVLTAFLPLGANTVTLRVVDSDGLSGSASAEITVRDTIPPGLELAVAPQVLWPPDHRLVPVDVVTTARDVCDSGVRALLVSVASSESDDLPFAGDGRTTEDVADAQIGTPDERISLRAERSAEGPGRTYSITYEALDASGNRTRATGLVTVPLNLAGRAAPLGSQPVSWRPGIWGGGRGSRDERILRLRGRSRSPVGRPRVLLSGPGDAALLPPLQGIETFWCIWTPYLPGTEILGSAGP